MMVFSMRVWGVVFRWVMVAMCRLSLCFESQALYTLLRLGLPVLEGLWLSFGGYASEWTCQSNGSEAFLFPALFRFPWSPSKLSSKGTVFVSPVQQIFLDSLPRSAYTADYRHFLKQLVTLCLIA